MRQRAGTVQTRNQDKIRFHAGTQWICRYGATAPIGGASCAPNFAMDVAQRWCSQFLPRRLRRMLSACSPQRTQHTVPTVRVNEARCGCRLRTARPACPSLCTCCRPVRSAVCDQIISCAFMLRHACHKTRRHAWRTKGTPDPLVCRSGLAGEHRRHCVNARVAAASVCPSRRQRVWFIVRTCTPANRRLLCAWGLYSTLEAEPWNR